MSLRICTECFGSIQDRKRIKLSEDKTVRVFVIFVKNLNTVSLQEDKQSFSVKESGGTGLVVGEQSRRK